MDDVDKIRNQIKSAEENAKRTKDLNYRKYNKYIVNKGVEHHKAVEGKQKRESDHIIKTACEEASAGIHHTMRDKNIFIFGDLTK